MPDPETFAVDEYGAPVSMPETDEQEETPVTEESAQKEAPVAQQEETVPETQIPAPSNAQQPQVPETQIPDASQHWYDTLPEDVRGNPNVTKYKSLDDLVHGHIELVRKLGEKGVPIQPPPENATNEQQLAYNAYRRGDKIKSPADYSFDKGSTAPDVVALKQAAWDAGLDDYQCSQMLNRWQQAYDGYEAERANNAKIFYQQEADKLHAEWGQDARINVKANDLFLNKNFKFAGEQLAAMGARGVASVEMMLHEINKRMTGEQQITWGQARSENLKDQLSRLQNSTAYKNEFDPGHEKAILQQAKIFQKIVRANKEQRETARAANA